MKMNAKMVHVRILAVFLLKIVEVKNVAYFDELKIIILKDWLYWHTQVIQINEIFFNNSLVLNKWEMRIFRFQFP